METTEIKTTPANCFRCANSRKDAEYKNILLCSKILDSIEPRDNTVSVMVVDPWFYCIHFE